MICHAEGKYTTEISFFLPVLCYVCFYQNIKYIFQKKFSMIWNEIWKARAFQQFL